MAVDFGSAGDNKHLYAETPKTLIGNLNSSGGDLTIDNYAYAAHFKSNGGAGHQNVLTYGPGTANERSSLFLARTTGGQDIKFTGHYNDSPYNTSFTWSLNTDHHVVMSVDNSQTTNISLYRDGTHSLNTSSRVDPSNAYGNDALKLNNDELFYGVYNADGVEAMSGISKYLFIVTRSVTSTEGNNFNTSPTTWVETNSLQNYATGMFSPVALSTTNSSTNISLTGLNETIFGVTSKTLTSSDNTLPLVTLREDGADYPGMTNDVLDAPSVISFEDNTYTIENTIGATAKADGSLDKYDHIKLSVLANTTLTELNLTEITGTETVNYRIQSASAIDTTASDTVTGSFNGSTGTPYNILGSTPLTGGNSGTEYLSLIHI